MRAFDCSEKRQSVKSFFSTSQPSSKGRRVAASTASMAASGAIMPRCFRRAVSRAAAKMGEFSSGVPSFSLRSRVLGAGFNRISRANAIAPASRSPSMIRSRIPNSRASRAETELPLAHISTALATPANRGRRCVPPAPGMMPSFTSSWPTCASGAATR